MFSIKLLCIHTILQSFICMVCYRKRNGEVGKVCLKFFSFLFPSSTFHVMESFCCSWSLHCRPLKISNLRKKNYFSCDQKPCGMSTALLLVSSLALYGYCTHISFHTLNKFLSLPTLFLSLYSSEELREQHF